MSYKKINQQRKIWRYIFMWWEFGSSLTLDTKRGICVNTDLRSVAATRYIVRVEFYLGEEFYFCSFLSNFEYLRYLARVHCFHCSAHVEQDIWQVLLSGDDYREPTLPRSGKRYIRLSQFSSFHGELVESVSVMLFKALV